VHLSSSSNLANIALAILPPHKETICPGVTVERCISTVQKGRLDVSLLQENLEHALRDMQVRSSPVCLAREQLYSEAFDELIRQVLLENPERGLLLLRVRDEIRMTVNVHLEVYRSTLNFGGHKLAEAEQGVDDMQRTIDNLKAEKKALTVRKMELAQKLLDTEDEISKKKIDDDRKHGKETAKLATQANTLRRFIDSLAVQKPSKKTAGKRGKKGKNAAKKRKQQQKKSQGEADESDGEASGSEAEGSSDEEGDNSEDDEDDDEEEEENENEEGDEKENENENGGEDRTTKKEGAEAEKGGADDEKADGAQKPSVVEDE
jgi:dynein light intermediate chain